MIEKVLSLAFHQSSPQAQSAFGDSLLVAFLSEKLRRELRQRADFVLSDHLGQFRSKPAPFLDTDENLSC